ncbi:hypothetical protein CNR22_19785 [Sphingobacteriaceae bacterium]|nr:hypothetical protein CNR22_19785 [Sphingobacteriaceae bacterium]
MIQSQTKFWFALWRQEFATPIGWQEILLWSLFAKELGATHLINSMTEDVQKRIKEILPNVAQYGLDTTGRKTGPFSILTF